MAGQDRGVGETFERGDRGQPAIEVLLAEEGVHAVVDEILRDQVPVAGEADRQLLAALSFRDALEADAGTVDPLLARDVMMIRGRPPCSILPWPVRASAPRIMSPPPLLIAAATGGWAYSGASASPAPAK